jgi:hypothetical protein
MRWPAGRRAPRALHRPASRYSNSFLSCIPSFMLHGESPGLVGSGRASRHSAVLHAIHRCRPDRMAPDREGRAARVRRSAPGAWAWAPEKASASAIDVPTGRPLTTTTCRARRISRWSGSRSLWLAAVHGSGSDAVVCGRRQPAGF